MNVTLEELRQSEVMQFMLTDGVLQEAQLLTSSSVSLKKLFGASFIFVYLDNTHLYYLDTL